MAFKVLVDTVQRRVAEPGVATLASGHDWDLAVSSPDVYVDSGTDTLMCRPGPLYPAWLTSNAGIFAKIALASFTLTDSSFGALAVAPIENTVNSGDAPYYYLADNTAGVLGVLKTSLAVNQAMVFEYFQGPQTPNRTIAGEFGWHNGGTATIGVSFRFYYDGHVEAWKDGVFLNEYTLSGEKKLRKKPNKQAKAAATTGEWISIMMIPCRGRELMVISSAGGSFTHVFDDIVEGTGSPVITLAQACWFNVPAGTTLNHRVALCQFSAGGDAYSAKSFFRVDPGAAPDGGWQTWQLADLTGGTLALSAADALTLGAYSNNVDGVRIKATLAGAGGLSPFVYGARVYTLPTVTKTIGPGVDITAYLQRGGTLESTDANSGLTGHLTFRNAPEIEALGVKWFATLGHRPFQIIDDDGEIWVDGLLMPPTTDCAIIYDPDTDQPTYNADGFNPAETISFPVRDRMQLCDEFEYFDDTPHDAETLQTSFTEDAIQMGFDPLEIRVSAFGGFTLPAGGAVTDREFNVMHRAGDRGSQSLKKQHEDFAANAFFGLDPSGGLQLTAEEDAPTDEPAGCVLYDSLATMDALGVDRDYRQLIREMRVVIVGPEAGDIYAVGMDYRNGRPFISHRRDAAASNPHLAPGARPINWCGGILPYSFPSDQLGTQDATDWACDLMYKRLTPVRALVEVVCDGRAKYRRGQVMRLELLKGGIPEVLSQLATEIGIAGKGIIGTAVKGRIKTWSVSLQHLAVPDDRGVAFAPWRPARYVLQVLDGVSDAANLHTRATSAVGIREEIRNRAVHRRRFMSDKFRGVYSQEFVGHNEV